MRYGLHKIWMFLKVNLFFSLTLVLPVFLGASPLQAQESNTVLPRCGISYPLGYDANTVGDVTGLVSSIVLPPKGPVSFELKAGRDVYTVLSSPPWYWRDNASGITAGVKVVVHGSKSLGMDKNLYIIAQEVKIISTGQVVEFRNAYGLPLWSRMRGMGSGRNSGSAGGTQNGSGSGFMRGRSR